MGALSNNEIPWILGAHLNHPGSAPPGTGAVFRQIPRVKACSQRRVRERPRDGGFEQILRPLSFLGCRLMLL